MSEARDPVFEPSSRISGHLAQIEGVEAVALGGSWARGAAHPDSDVDIGIYYRSESPPSIGELRRVSVERLEKLLEAVKALSSR